MSTLREKLRIKQDVGNTQKSHNIIIPIPTKPETIRINKITIENKQGNFDISELIKRLDENKLKIEVLEFVLALQKAERRLISDNTKIDMLKKRLLLIEAEYRRGKGELDSLTKYWEIEMKLRDDKASTEDEITLQKAKLEQLVGVL